jgi:hypothetical protein
VDAKNPDLELSLSALDIDDDASGSGIQVANTSDLILLIIIANLIQNGTDLEYIECMADKASKIQDRRRSRLPKASPS